MIGEKFTEGPYTVETDQASGAIWIESPDSGTGGVCDLYHIHGKVLVKKPNAKANAHLLAAAWDLYGEGKKSCEAMVLAANILCKNGLGTEAGELAARASFHRGALAKARGEGAGTAEGRAARRVSHPASERLPSKLDALWCEIDALGGSAQNEFDAGYNEGLTAAIAELEKCGFAEGHSDAAADIDNLQCEIASVKAALKKSQADLKTILAALNERSLFSNPTFLKKIADELDCDCESDCESKLYECDTGAGGCHKSEHREFCRNDLAETLRSIARVTRTLDVTGV